MTDDKEKLPPTEDNEKETCDQHLNGIRCVRVQGHEGQHRTRKLGDGISREWS